MSFDLGAVIARVVWDDVGFNTGYSRAQRRMAAFAQGAARTSGGVRKLDLSMSGAAASATRAAGGMDKAAAAAKRASTTTTGAAAANDKAAAGATRLAAAQARVAAVMQRTAGMSTRQRILALQNMAAQEKLAAAHAGAGSAAARQAQLTSRLASAQATALGTSKRFAAAQAMNGASLIAAGKKMNRAITVPILAAGAVAIHEAAQFEQATNVYVTAAGESAKNLDVIRAGIKRVATETGTSIDNLTEAEYVLQKAGYRGADGIKVLDASAKGAREENAQLSDVVQAMTSIMSAYNIPASKAVQVMNALKTGAGSAKVSMEDYTRALSTALPIASANHISIDQLLGAYSQLTQAGNTAQYSTQLLSSTIRALAAPNRVAQKQMQQFGIDVNDVTSKIGQRGLSGTLKIYIDAITKHLGKGGLVVQDAFNKQASAMQDVNIMLGKMPAEARNLSKAYLEGKVTLGDWRLAVKALPTDQAAIARNFAAVADRTHAFNDLLKAGDPAAQTFAAALRKMSNGAIGMNTILQLMGNNFEGVDTRAAAVAKSLNNTDHEVEGWHSTAGLASVKADQLKESLHVLAIDAGNELLPMFKRAVEGLTGVVHSFQGLDSSQKQVLGWSLGIMAAIGPLMFIGGKLMRVGAGLGTAGRVIGSRLALIAGASEATATRVGVAGARIGAALGAAGIGYAIGSLTKNASAGKKALGLFGSAATGAMMGMGAGPVGAAIGGATGLLAGLAGQFTSSGDAAKEATAGVDAFTEALRRDSDAIGTNVRNLAAMDLQKNGTFKFGRQLGLDPKLLTDAATGNKEARRQIETFLDKVSSQGLAGKQAADHIRAALGAERDVIAEGKQANRDLDQANSAAGKVAAAQASKLQALKKAQADYNSALSNRLNVQVATTGSTALTGSTTAAKQNAAAIEELAKKARDLQINQVQAGVSMGTAARNANANAAALRNAAVAAGFNGAQVDRLIGKYKITPKQVVTRMVADIAKGTASASQLQRVINAVQQNQVPGLTADSAQGRAAVAALQERINSLTGKAITIPIIPDFSRIPSNYKLPKGAKTGGGPNGNGHSAKGSRSWTSNGKLPPGLSTVGERGWELVKTDSAGRSEVVSHAQSMRETGLPDVLPGFAGGTKAGRRVGDTEYASERAAANARRRETSQKAKARADQAKAIVQSAIGSIGQAPTSQIDLSQAGYGRVAGQIRRATDALNAQIRKGLSGAAERQARAQIKNLTIDANRQLTNLRVKIRTSDMAAIHKALKGTAEDVASAFDTVIADARNAGASASTVAILQSGQRRLIAKQTQIANARQRLADIKEYRSGIGDTLGQGLELGKFGSVADMVAGFTDAAGTNNSYAKQVSTITNRVKGNKTLADLAQKLADEGNTASLQTLAGASTAELAQISKAYAAYGGSLSAGGDAASRLKYGTTATGQQANINTLVGQQNELVGAMGDLAVLMARRPDIRLSVGGHAITATVVKDPQFEAAIAGALQRIRHASQRGRKR